MNKTLLKDKTCVVIGASHAGVNFAFALRREGWAGAILLFDADPMLPYHRPPLSKSYLYEEGGMEKHLLQSAERYEQEGIQLRLGVLVSAVDRANKCVRLQDGSVQAYDKLVLATGARPLLPSIPGVESASHLYTLRTAADVTQIRYTLQNSDWKRVVIIGGGYIGLETAASLKKLGAGVTVLERETRLLARVTAPEMSQFFEQLHKRNGVGVFTSKNVTALQSKNGVNEVICSDGSRFIADMIIVGVGIRVNLELAKDTGLETENGIRVDGSARTSDEDIYAIGDCTFHHNPHYDRFLRLECVQNAVDQAKVAAAAICSKEVMYNSLPWFWSDQYDVKLQMVGLSEGYDEAVVRREVGEGAKFSIWYFKEGTLLAVDAVNNAKAYVLGTKSIKDRRKVDKLKLMDPSVDLTQLPRFSGSNSK